jgi:hypothetical protein
MVFDEEVYELLCPWVVEVAEVVEIVEDVTVEAAAVGNLAGASFLGFGELGEEVS